MMNSKNTITKVNIPSESFGTNSMQSKQTRSKPAAKSSRDKIDLEPVESPAGSFMASSSANFQTNRRPAYSVVTHLTNFKVIADGNFGNRIVGSSLRSSKYHHNSSSVSSGSSSSYSSLLPHPSTNISLTKRSPLGDRIPTRKGQQNLFTKERFIHANFRFVIRECRWKELHKCAPWTSSPNRPLPWQVIELVLVPYPSHDNPVCPICLCVPIAPKLTRCGHFFCWPCILKYVAMTSPSTGPSGKWRSCPVCFESLHPKQLMSVQFYATRGDPTVSPLRVPQMVEFVLVYRPANSIEIRPLDEKDGNVATNDVNGECEMIDKEKKLINNKLFEHADNPYCKDGLEEEWNPLSSNLVSSLQRFQKIFVKNDQFVKEAIIEEELRRLGQRLAILPKDELEERPFIELAMTLALDRKISLENPVTGDCISEVALEFWSDCYQMTTPLNNPAMYFHQSSDGQALFLHPLSIKMLRYEFGEYSKFPTRITAPLLELDTAVLNEDLAKRYKHVSHLPYGCHFGLCEVDFTRILSERTLELFSEELKYRAHLRNARQQRDDELALEAHSRQMAAEMAEFYSGPGVAIPLLGCTGNKMLELDDLDSFPLPSSSYMDNKSTDELGLDQVQLYDRQEGSDYDDNNDDEDNNDGNNNDSNDIGNGDSDNESGDGNGSRNQKLMAGQTNRTNLATADKNDASLLNKRKCIPIIKSKGSPNLSASFASVAAGSSFISDEEAFPTLSELGSSMGKKSQVLMSGEQLQHSFRRAAGTEVTVPFKSGAVGSLSPGMSIGGKDEWIPLQNTSTIESKQSISGEKNRVVIIPK